MNRHGRQVIKLGGSLLDMQDWLERLLRFLARCDHDGLGCDDDVNGNVGGGVCGGRGWGVLVVGGGRAADLVRDWCAMHVIDDVTGHGLAVEAMRFNSRMVATVLRDVIGECPWVKNVSELNARSDARLVIVDPVAWLIGSDVPQVWQFTSDSIAAHVATMIGAERLTLLKSTLPSGGGVGGGVGAEVGGDNDGENHPTVNPGTNSEKTPGANSEKIPGALAADEKLSGVVDDWFLRTSANVSRVDLVNLRDDALPTWRLR